MYKRQAPLIGIMSAFTICPNLGKLPLGQVIMINIRKISSMLCWTPPFPGTVPPAPNLGSHIASIYRTSRASVSYTHLDVYKRQDKDYGQLVGEHVWMYRPRHGGGYETLGEKEICAKYSIDSPLQVIDILALMGDTADNFPGCPCVGEKTAIKLINQLSLIHI